MGWTKRQVFPDLEVASSEELWKALDDACEEDPCGEDARTRRHGPERKLLEELFEEEVSSCGPRVRGREGLPTARTQASPGGLVHVDGSRSSVPIRLRGRRVRIQLYWDERAVTREEEELARFRRD